ncbi:Alpha/beta hydrolase of unknown function [Chitinophaga sp. CF118]|uniref:alpha/beta hydrolase n=1 Tax=Chitinophaga sp. CF118 TaxID=1884367 RepID=UPI0008ECB51B|nr:alpha/beta hydrolase [Chitinophaga sp. CF118]SFE23964.1 Alpha/beta hydrolase of unknown function [Chitinophaga sp. CF118]
MKRLLILLLLALSSVAYAQLSFYNSDAYWSNFCLQTSCVEASVTDTCLVFVSNRHLHPDNLRFVDEYVDTTGLKYFFLRKRAGKWNVYQASSLKEAMLLLPEKRDIVVYTEGMGKIFTTNVERALLMRSQYHVNVVMFDYSSINTTYKPTRNFNFAKKNARLSAPDYFQLLKTLQKARLDKEDWVQDVKISTFYHSMGNIILMEMMQHQPYQDLNSQPFIDNLVINAACVPQKKHKEWVEHIQFASKVYIHYNRTDWQLKAAHILTFKAQLGEKVRRQRAANATYVNFHGQGERQHSYFLNFPQNDYRMTDAMKEYFGSLFTGNTAKLKDDKSPLLISN